MSRALSVLFIASFTVSDGTETLHARLGILERSPGARQGKKHILPKSKGGTDSDDNTVACCTALNQAFGNMDLKQKLRVILDKAGKFTCPNP